MGAWGTGLYQDDIADETYTCEILAAAPVSYTHLDVYKRQTVATTKTGSPGITICKAGIMTRRSGGL